MPPSPHATPVAGPPAAVCHRAQRAADPPASPHPACCCCCCSCCRRRNHTVRAPHAFALPPAVPMKPVPPASGCCYRPCCPCRCCRSSSRRAHVHSPQATAQASPQPSLPPLRTLSAKHPKARHCLCILLLLLHPASAPCPCPAVAPSPTPTPAWRQHGSSPPATPRHPPRPASREARCRLCFIALHHRPRQAGALANPHAMLNRTCNCPLNPA